MRLFLSLLVSGVLLAPALFAQMKPTLVVEIPFDFYLGDKPFAKGPYELRVLHASGVVFLESRTDIKVSAAAGASPMSSPSGVQSEPMMVFTKYDGDHTFLRTAVWGYDSGRVMQLSKSRTEREHVTTTFNPATPVTQAKPQTLTVMARAR